MSDCEEFQNTSSGASITYPQQCSALRKGGFFVCKGKPCKIVEMSTSKTGKHGHAKVHLVGLDIFTNKKYEDICPSTHNMDVPHVIRKDYMLLSDIDDIDEYVSVMDVDAGTSREDLKINSVLLSDLQKDCNRKKQAYVTVVKSMETEEIMALKWEE